jgi:hypothetical protein
MKYPVTSWHGSRNMHCPFCNFASTSSNARAQIDAHVAAVHPAQLRKAMVDDASEALVGRRTKADLLEQAAAAGIEGLTDKNTRVEIAAALKAAEETASAAAEAEAAAQAAATEPPAEAAAAPAAPEDA